MGVSKLTKAIHTPQATALILNTCNLSLNRQSTTESHHARRLAGDPAGELKRERKASANSSTERLTRPESFLTSLPRERSTQKPELKMAAEKTKTVVAFDLYGTILDTESISVELGKHIGAGYASDVALLWRRYQLEYTWRINSMGRC